MASFPCITNQQMYPVAQASDILKNDKTIERLEELSEFETYRWDLYFKSSATVDTVSFTIDQSGTRHINLLTGNNLLRWQIGTPHDDDKHAGSPPFTWNVHVYF